MLKFIRSIIIILLLAFISYMLYLIVQQNSTRLAIDENNTPVIVQQLRAAQRLQTADMTITKILEGKQELTDYLPGYSWDNQLGDFLFGEKVAMQIYGTVTAGFDLSQISSGAIVGVWSGVVDIHLPAPQILHTSLDPSTQVFDKELWLLNKGDKDTETQLRNTALDIIRQAALEEWILSAATTNAQTALQSILGNTTTIRSIVTKDPTDSSLSE